MSVYEGWFVTIESLYFDEPFDNMILDFARRDFLSFDDLKQEVFSCLITHPKADRRKAVNRIAMRMRRAQAKHDALNIDEIDAYRTSRTSTELWEDCHVIA